MSTARELTARMDSAVTDALLAGEGGLAIAARLGLDYDADSGCVVLPGYRADDGHAEVDYSEMSSGREAADAYVASGDWSGDVDEDDQRTCYIHVHTWRVGLRLVDDDAASDEREVEACSEIDTETHVIDVDPTEPRCASDVQRSERKHDWSGNDSTCPHCGVRRIERDDATDAGTGQQGKHMIRYIRPD
jgi:hypothetical protein